jgi:DNA polymerase III delta subunit
VVSFQDKEIREETLVPCYFFYGEENFPAYQFVDKLKEILISGEAQDYNIERFGLEDNSWAEIIDTARTIPLFLTPRRLVVVEVPQGKRETLSQQEKDILKEYFSSPSSKTVIVIIYSGRLKRSTSLFKFFSSLSSSAVCLIEMKPLKYKPLMTWMDRTFSSMGKTVTFEAKRRLEELAGNDLRRLNSEIEKLTIFVDEKKVVELDDVNQVSGWVRSSPDWEIADSLGKADLTQGLIVLNNLFRDGTKPEYILGTMVKFFREIFLAKLMLKEKNTDKKAIFKELKPHINEKFGNFYADKFREFFSLVERIPMKDLRHFFGELENVDLKIKTSGLNPRTLMESFLFDYCDLRKKEEITWREKS